MDFDDWFTLDSRSGAALRVYRAHPQGEPRGTLLVHHGLAEHAGRYGAFARLAADRGFAVYAHDHRGHGSTVAPDAPLRRVAKTGGAAKLVSDARAVHEHALGALPDHPVLLLGHSMGGLVAMNYAQSHGRDLAGLAVWNADLRGGARARAARAALKVERALKGSDVASEWARRATFDAWGKSIAGRRTAFDWLSHDAAVVDEYVEDPLCGFTPTVSMMADVVDLVLKGGSTAGLSMLPRTLPVHLLTGTADPAGGHGAALGHLAQALARAKLADVTLRVVEGARHETLKEIPRYRQVAMDSLFVWLDRVAPPHG